MWCMAGKDAPGRRAAALLPTTPGGVTVKSSQPNRRRLRSTLKTTAVLLALFARDHGGAQAAGAERAAPAARPSQAAPASPPESPQALRQRLFALAEDGSPQLALEQATARPEVFSRADLLQLEHLVVAQEIRWARQQAGASNAPDRLAAADHALAGADALLERIPPDESYQALRRTAQADRLTALAVRGRMAEASALYEQIAPPAGEPLPAAAYVAAGDAYAYQDKPDLAAHAYELALQSPREPIAETTEPYALTRVSVQESLFFAYLDQGRYETAHALVTSMLRTTPAQDALSVDIDKTNPDYGTVMKLQAQYLLYTNHVDEGVRALDALRRDAPFDPTLLTARADGALVQERPHGAQELYQQVHNDHPEDIASLAGIGETSLQRYQFEQARTVATTFGAGFPDNNAVRLFERDYRIYERPQLIIEAGGERGNAALADQAWAIDTHLYSSPLALYWRVFAHQFSGRADTGNGNSVSRVRNGAGVDYRRDGWEASAEVHQSTGGEGRTGGTGTLAYQPDDHWRFSLGFDSDANDLPWKAYQAGVTGRTGTASARYSQDDRRYFNLSYALSRYSDTNLNQQWLGTVYQRLLNTPRHQVSLWLDVGTDSNTLAGTAYFNPRRDYIAQVRSMYQWTPWRYADRSFSQRVYVSAGGYHQDGFGDSMLWEARLEHYWQLGRKASLTYGIGIGSRRYDAARETSKLIYLTLNVPL